MKTISSFRSRAMNRQIRRYQHVSVRILSMVYFALLLTPKLSNLEQLDIRRIFFSTPYLWLLNQLTSIQLETPKPDHKIIFIQSWPSRPSRNIISHTLATAGKRKNFFQRASNQANKFTRHEMNKQNQSIRMEDGIQSEGSKHNRSNFSLQTVKIKIKINLHSSFIRRNS